MKDITDLNWIEEDKAEFLKYGFFDVTLEDIGEFYKAKTAFLLNPCDETVYWMKYRFQIAHSALKTECSCRTISPQRLDELTELLRKGV